MRIIKTAAFRRFEQYEGKYNLDWDPEDAEIQMDSHRKSKDRFRLMDDPNSGTNLVDPLRENWPPGANSDPELQKDLSDLAVRLEIDVQDLFKIMKRDGISLLDEYSIRSWINGYLREPR